MRKVCRLSPLLLSCLVVLAGCGKNLRGGGAETSAGTEAYERIAEKISDGRKRMKDRRVAVLPFAYTNSVSPGDGVVISERLLTAIINRNELAVVERGLLDKVLAELKLQRSGIIDPKTIKDIGKILGVEAVVSGTLTRRKAGLVEINARLINVESAAVLAAAAETVVPDWVNSPPPKIVYAQPPQPAPQGPEGKLHYSPIVVPLAPPARGGCLPGLLAYWNFNDDYGSTPPDSPIPVRTFGIAGIGMRFDGVDDYLDISAAAGLSEAAGTVELWFSPSADLDSGSSAFPRGHYLLEHNGRLGLIYQNGAFSLRAYNSSSREMMASYRIDLKAGNWYHVAGTWDSRTYRLYVNGVERASVPGGKWEKYPPPRMYLGAEPYDGPQEFARGTIDEVAIFDRALPGEEILRQYETGLEHKELCSS